MRIKSSKHFFTFLNFNKNENLNIFITEYRRVASGILDNIWKNGYTWQTEDKDNNIVIHEFNVNKNLLNHPAYFDYNKFNVETSLTARALSSLTTQLAGIIGASVEKQRKRLIVFNKKKSENVSNAKLKQLILRMKQNIPVKPNVSNINPELSSKCLDWKDVAGYFDGFLRLKSIFDNKIEIKIPIQFHKHSTRLQQLGGVMMNSFLISTNYINIRWELPEVELKTEGIVVGADQGMKDILTCSDKQVTPKHDKHNHNLDSVLDKMASAKRGSKRFGRLQVLRKNIINYSLNSLDFSNIKQINLERIFNIQYKNRTSKKLSHWTNTLIRDKVELICEQQGVSVVHQTATYRSQRCSACGLVRKANRKGKTYFCNNCGLEIDADYNASLNHEASLPEIPYTLRKLNLNRKGFFWKESGFFDLAGTSLESVPPVEVNASK